MTPLTYDEFQTRGCTLVIITVIITPWNRNDLIVKTFLSFEYIAFILHVHRKSTLEHNTMYS